jgi:solute carrier family 31 (copper transporter), member 1
MAPFIAAHDIPRGAIHALQASLGYTLMLAVMYVFSSYFPMQQSWRDLIVSLTSCRTFQAAYFITVVIGLGLGEVLFGRIGGSTHVH